jgi:hypothetical protein
MKKLSILILVAILATACQKEGASPKLSGATPQPTGTSFPIYPIQLNGTYKGSFSATLAGGQGAEVPVGFTVSGDQFNTAAVNAASDNIHYGVGDGTVALSSNTLSFQGLDAFPDNMTAGQIYPYETVGLNGNYNYTVKGDSLLLSKTSGGGTYKLKKQ